MSININITGQQIPASPVFIEYIFNYLNKKQHESAWADQLTEGLSYRQVDTLNTATAALKELSNKPEAQRLLVRSYEYMISILLGDLRLLKVYQEKYKFVCIVGCPRSGGSYLTRQIYNAIGYAHVDVPTSIAHDGFPSSEPFTLAEEYNSHTRMIRHLAEYLVMVESYFDTSGPGNSCVIVPKKINKLAYNGAFFTSVFGDMAEYIITVRHPISACVSTYEKAGGLPPDNKFCVRSNIEGMIEKDLQFLGHTSKGLSRQEYIEVYLKYWENYYINLAVTGLSSSRVIETVPYTKQRMMGFSESCHQRYSSVEVVDEFQVYDKRDVHDEWSQKACKAIDNVANVWESVGMTFPVEDVNRRW